MIYPRLKGLSSPDLPAGELPAVPDDCSVLIDAEIGPSNSEGADLFSFQVVTPKWLLRDDAVLWGRGLLIVTEFSWPKVSTAVEKLLMHAARSDWSGVAQELAKELHWEFEHYSQAP
ncbi:MAG TPA: Imm8 family immunity protein [Thermoanaerobaculia bacterium]|nr:Imm8 family immunity protein [Thermoanaerobaculia bacterium]